MLNRPWIRSVTSLLITLSVMAVLTLVVMAHSVPDFYRPKCAATWVSLPELCATMQEDLQQLREDASREGRWHAAFSDDQINGWLTVDLPTRFPRLLPAHVKDPWVAIQTGEAHIACLYQNGNACAVLSLVLETFLTDRDDEIGLRIRSARIGAVPGLTDKAVDAITYAARRARVKLRWQRLGDEPVAVVRLPRKLFAPHCRVRLEKISLSDGTLCIHGRSVAAPPLPKRRGPAGRRRHVAVQRNDQS